MAKVRERLCALIRCNSETDGYSPDGRKLAKCDTWLLILPPCVHLIHQVAFCLKGDFMNKTKKITTMGMLSASAYLFTLIGHFIPISFTDFLRYDPKDAIIVLAGLALGPLSAFIISLIVAFIELITISTTGIIGFIMNVISSSAFACVAAFVYKRSRTIKSAALGLVLSSITTVVLMLLWNYLITPLYMGVPRTVIEAMLLPVFLPFNVIKCGLNSALVMIIYKPCVQAMRQIGLLPRKMCFKSEVAQDNAEPTYKAHPVSLIVSLIVALLMVLLFVFFEKPLTT